MFKLLFVASLSALADAAAPPADPYFPGYFPRMHAGHNNDVNGPFFYRGRYHLFLHSGSQSIRGSSGTGRYTQGAGEHKQTGSRGAQRGSTGRGRQAGRAGHTAAGQQ